MNGFALKASHASSAGALQVGSKPSPSTKPQAPAVLFCMRPRRMQCTARAWFDLCTLLCSTQHCRSGNSARHICSANDRTAAPDAAQVPSPDGSAVLESSEQFKVHLLAALEDPRVKQRNEVTPEVNSLVDELKSVSPKDRKKLTMDGVKGTFRGVMSDIDRMTKDGVTDLGTMSFQQFKPVGTTVKASQSMIKMGIDYDNQYQVDIPLTIQDGPLAGIEAMQSTIGEYTVDDEEPTKQKIGFTGLALKLNTSDSAAKEKWLDVMRRENEKMDEEGKIMLTFPQPMQGFRDFLFFDEDLQITIGNRGSLVIIQR